MRDLHALGGLTRLHHLQVESVEGLGGVAALPALTIIALHGVRVTTSYCWTRLQRLKLWQWESDADAGALVAAVATLTGLTSLNWERQCSPNC